MKFNNSKITDGIGKKFQIFTQCPEFIYLTGGHKLVGVGCKGQGQTPGSDNRLSVQYPCAPFLSSLQEI